MILMEWDEKEIEYGRLAISVALAETDEEEKEAMKNLERFEKENRELVDEIQSRRWTRYGPDE